MESYFVDWKSGESKWQAFRETDKSSVARSGPRQKIRTPLRHRWRKKKMVMPRVPMTELLADAQRGRYAVCRGELNGRRIKAGDEFLVTFLALQSPYRLKRLGTEVLEVFALFPPRD